jgi:Secretion system C-terminal sorting domain
MKKVLLLVICFPGFLLSQQNTKGDFFWEMGYGSFYPQQQEFGGTNIDFNYSPPNFYRLDRHIDFDKTSAGICDDNGNILLYTNGIAVAGADDDTLEGGENINPTVFTNSYCGEGGTIPQGALVLPYPNHTNQFMIVYSDLEILPNGALYPPFKLKYALVDMTENNAKGKVLSKQKVIIQDTISAYGITACRHANGRDWWLMIPQVQSNCFYRVLLSSNGFNVLGKQCTSDINAAVCWNAYFSPNGHKYARQEMDRVRVFDFDRCTGLLSNQVWIPITDGGRTGGLAFSPNSQFLYISSEYWLYQADLTAFDIPTSKVLVATCDTVKVNGLENPFWFCGTASDGKIYITTSTIPFFHVINYPNLAYPFCYFVQRGQPLPTINGWTMPNFPNFRLGAEIGSGCDTLLSNQLSVSSYQAVNVFPNPAQDRLTIEGLPVGARGEIYNIVGQEVQAFKAEKAPFSLSVADIPEGMYILQFQHQAKSWKQKIIIQR